MEFMAKLERWTNDNIANSESIKFKLKKARKTPDNDNKNNN